jgi:acetyl esterase/lipase
VLVAVVLAGCSPTDLLNATTASGGTTEIFDVAYEAGPRHGLDVYVPAPTGKPAPIAVFFYGGSWMFGNKEMYRFLGRSLARRGVLVVIPDYGVYPPAVFPDFLADAARAVTWTKQHGAEYGGDPSRLYLAGHSAGAYIAAMLALDAEWLQGAGLNSRTDIAGTIGISGPYDFVPDTPSLIAIFGQGTQVPRTQPITYADGNAAPMRLITGDADTTVQPGNTFRLAARIHAAGGSAQTIVYPGVGHIGIVGAFAPSLEFWAPTLRDTAAFINPAANPGP